MWLNRLVPEALALVLYFLSANELAKLWFCGCSTLNYRLSLEARVFDLQYDWNARFRNVLRWPKLLRSLPRLTRVMIRSPHKNQGYIVTDVDFSDIAPTITHLELAWSTSLVELLQLDESFPPSAHMLLLDSSKEICLADFRSRFPRLETLTWANNLRLPSINWHTSIQHLPKSITSFSGPRNQSIPFIAICSLPTTLRELNAEVPDLPRDWKPAERFPDLTTLILRFIIDYRFISELPAMLNRLELHIADLYVDDANGDQSESRDLIAAHAVSLPQSLRRLLISGPLSVQEGFLESLPHSIEWMKLDVYSFSVSAPSPPPSDPNWSGTHANAPNYGLFPPKLRHLDLGQAGMRDILSNEHHIRYLPTSLTSLPGRVSLQPEFWSYIPPSLTSLDLVLWNGAYASSLWKLQLQSLSLESASVGFAHALPDSITELFIEQIDYNETAGVDVALEAGAETQDDLRNTDAQPNALCLDRLNRVEQFHSYQLFERSQLSWSTTRSSFLTELNFPIRFSYTELDLSLPWAANLRTITLRGESKRDNASDMSGNDEVEWFQKLPRSCTAISLHHRPAPSSTVLLHLPERLTTFSAILRDAIDTTHLQLLPPSLTGLSLRGPHSSVSISDLLKTLPSRLCSLSFPFRDDIVQPRNDSPAACPLALLPIFQHCPLLEVVYTHNRAFFAPPCEEWMCNGQPVAFTSSLVD